MTLAACWNARERERARRRSSWREASGSRLEGWGAAANSVRAGWAAGWAVAPGWAKKIAAAAARPAAETRNNLERLAFFMDEVLH
jgi:hypothetical protein